MEAGKVEEVREIQTAFALVAAAAGPFIILAVSQRQRPGYVRLRILADEAASSPVMMSYLSGAYRGNTEMTLTIYAAAEASSL